MSIRSADEVEKLLVESKMRTLAMFYAFRSMIQELEPIASKKISRRYVPKVLDGQFRFWEFTTDNGLGDELKIRVSLNKRTFEPKNYVELCFEPYWNDKKLGSTTTNWIDTNGTWSDFIKEIEGLIPLFRAPKFDRATIEKFVEEGKQQEKQYKDWVRKCDDYSKESGWDPRIVLGYKMDLTY